MNKKKRMGRKQAVILLNVEDHTKIRNIATIKQLSVSDLLKEWIFPILDAETDPFNSGVKR